MAWPFPHGHHKEQITHRPDHDHIAYSHHTHDIISQAKRITQKNSFKAHLLHLSFIIFFVTKMTVYTQYTHKFFPFKALSKLLQGENVQNKTGSRTK